MCPQSPLGVLKNCGANKHAVCGRLQRNSGSFFLTSTDGICGHLYVSQSVVCEMETVEERALCGRWLFQTKSVTQTQRNDRAQLNKQSPVSWKLAASMIAREVADRV
jgi:hypothetical protein